MQMCIRDRFYADPNTGDRKVKVVVGIGDGRGYEIGRAHV